MTDSTLLVKQLKQLKAKRAKGIKDSSAHLTKAQKDASKAKASAIRKTGKEADHIIEIQESIGYLEQLELEKNLVLSQLGSTTNS